MRPYPNLWARIRAHVSEAPAPAWTELGTACWLWQGKLNARGYGWLPMRRPVYDDRGRPRGNLPRNVLVHRLVLLLTGYEAGEVPVASHLCGVKRCCNPEHLEPATPAENRLRYWLIELPARQAEREAGEDDET